MKEMLKYRLLCLFLLLLVLFSVSESSVGIQKKFLFKANNSICITKIKSDGLAQVQPYVLSDIDGRITQYSSPVMLPNIQPTGKPSGGYWTLQESLQYCFSEGSKYPLSVHVNTTEKKIIANKMNTVHIPNCQQIILADIDGDGENQVIIMATDFNNKTSPVTLVILESIDHSPEKIKVRYNKITLKL